LALWETFDQVALPQDQKNTEDSQIVSLEYVGIDMETQVDAKGYGLQERIYPILGKVFLDFGNGTNGQLTSKIGARVPMQRAPWIHSSNSWRASLSSRLALPEPLPINAPVNLVECRWRMLMRSMRPARNVRGIFISVQLCFWVGLYKGAIPILGGIHADLPLGTFGAVREE
jgi:hypothetical protein